MHSILPAMVAMALTNSQIVFGAPAIGGGCADLRMAWGPRVPGNSPANFIGDPHPDILQEINMNMDPNPPTDLIHIVLEGTVSRDIGPDPTITFAINVNGSDGFTKTGKFSRNANLEISQNDRVLDYDAVPRPGPVKMVYDSVFPFFEYPRGWYTVSVIIKATDQSRITAFQGTIWVPGDEGGGGIQLSGQQVAKDPLPGILWSPLKKITLPDSIE